MQRSETEQKLRSALKLAIRERGRMKGKMNSAMQELARYKKIVKNRFGTEPQSTIDRLINTNRNLAQELEAVRTVMQERITDLEAQINEKESNPERVQPRTEKS